MYLKSDMHAYNIKQFMVFLISSSNKSKKYRDTKQSIKTQNPKHKTIT